MPIAARALLFDLDGTLADTIPDLTTAIDTMLRTLDLPAAGEPRVRTWVGCGVANLVRAALRYGGEAEPGEARFQQALDAFNQVYAAGYDQETRLYPETVACLDWLRDRQVPMAIVSNKPIGFTEPLVAKLGIADYFGCVLGGDSLPQRKPDPAPLFHAAATIGAAREGLLMVGDSSNDVQAARNAGIPVVCLSYGYNHGEDIRDAAPDAVIDSLAELPPLLDLEVH